MDKNTFKNDFVVPLALHFGQDKFVNPGDMTKKRLSSWYQQAEKVPNEALSWIAGQIKDNFEYFPHNLSKTVLQLWEQWQRDHPKKIIKGEKGGCPECDGGWILAWRQEDFGKRKIWNSYAFRCPCNKVNGPGAAMSRQNLEAAGWLVQRLYPPDAMEPRAGKEDPPF